MPISPPCVCRHEPDAHHRQMDGVERCGGWTEGFGPESCKCVGYVPKDKAPLCRCGHMAGMHSLDGRLDGRACRFEKMCGCSLYRAIPYVPLEQLRQVAEGCTVIVAVVPIEHWDPNDPATRTAEIIAGDLTDQAHIVVVQEGPGLYYVSKHPERDKINGSYTTDEMVIENLLRLKEKYG